MSSAILTLFGFATTVHKSPPPPELTAKEKLALAELDYERSIFANALACASVSNEAVKVCNQSADVRRATQTYSDQRKTEPVSLAPVVKTCGECEYRDQHDLDSCICLNPDVLAVKSADDSACEFFEEHRRA